MFGGKLDRKITIQQPTEAANAAGEVAITGWTTWHSPWASKRPLRGSERFLADARRASHVSIWEIRYKTGITTKMRITDDLGVVYKINSFQEIGRREGWQIEAEMMEGGQES
jgi:SPP1 family predicted phage head-tail adaptor